MKKSTPAVLTAATLVILVGGYAVYRTAGDRNNPDGGQPVPVPSAGPPPDTTSTDGVAVFQKAFWRRPGEGDRILHAERREWLDGDGVSQWQWFIAVEPSPALVKYLREENAFGLTPDTAGGNAAGTVAGFQKAPAWFPAAAAGFDVLRSPAGALRLLFSKTSPQLYATDSGHGFRAGAASPAAPQRDSMGASARHRLPDAPPPNPPPP